MNVFQQNFIDNLAWFAISTIVLVILLPIYTDWREYRKRRTVRRMIASRISRVMQMIDAYLKVADTATDRIERERYLMDLKNAIHHMMAIPSHFSSALTGQVGSAYYTFRVISTNVAATATLSLKDYEAIFRDIFFTHAVIPKSSIAELDSVYRFAIKALGGDIHTVQAMQPVIPPWNYSQVQRLETIYAKLHANHNQTTPATIDSVSLNQSTPNRTTKFDVSGESVETN